MKNSRRLRHRLHCRFLQWRINRYLRLVRKGYHAKKALKWSFISAHTLAEMCVIQLGDWLPENPEDPQSVMKHLFGVGAGHFTRGGGLSMPNLDQAKLYISILGSLAPALTDEERTHYRDLINVDPLIKHSWGLIRRATAKAVMQLNFSA